MSYQVLYRTYRPKKFSEVVGQDYIVKTLLNSIKLNKIAHAYIFAGPRGTGKTTIAKLFAKAINCENFDDEACDKCDSCKIYNEGNHPDIIELDAASNNGVDDIREIIDQVSYAPINGKYKVYIIDEAHMLSTSAFNALLKTLEEPPAHVIFILATTDPQKIIPTVLSRCQRYNFSKISNIDIKNKIIEILKQEKINYDEQAIKEIAILSEGGMRDALSIVEQIMSYNSEGIFEEDVQKIFGLSSTEKKMKLIEEIHDKNTSNAISLLRDMYQEGVDIKRLAVDLLEILKEAIIFSDNNEEKLLTKLSKLEALELLNKKTPVELLKEAKLLEELIVNNKRSQNFLSYFELCLINMEQIDSTNTSHNVKAVKVETKKEEPIKKEELTEKENKVTEQKETITQETKDDDISYIASLLLSASKDDKIKDSIIYNKLELYKLEADKRKFYELLNKTELFASGRDAIVIVATPSQASKINSREINDELYGFLLNEFGIDKVLFAISENQKKDLIGTYRKLKDQKAEPGKVVKPYVQRKKTNEEKLKELFDDIVVE